MTAAITRRHRRAYFAAISYTDSLIGAVMDALATSGLGDSTVVALWADHGWALGDNNEWGKHTAFVKSNHVPLIFAPPPVPARIRMRCSMMVVCGSRDPNIAEQHRHTVDHGKRWQRQRKAASAD